MKRTQLFTQALRCAVLSAAVPASAVATSLIVANAEAADLSAPLVLKAQGSFFIGGHEIAAAAGDLGKGAAPGHIMIDQMYVEYMIPERAAKVPVVMVHGGGLSGKSFQTTPDGRMGWNEYFVRQGHPVYNADQVARARSGFNPTVFNQVRAGLLPPTALPNITSTSEEAAWMNFRFGPSFGVPWPDEQFPVDHLADFAKEGIPDLNGMLTPPTPPALSSPDSYRVLADLAIQLNGAVLMGHSESSDFPLKAVLTNSTGIRGAIFLETTVPTRCLQFTDEEIAKLATVPILFEFNDHLDFQPAGVLASFNNCKALIAKINAAGGNATMLHPPELGIHGNSHMVMLDRNNLQIADLILKWMDENVENHP